MTWQAVVVVLYGVVWLAIQFWADRRQPRALRGAGAKLLVDALGVALAATFTVAEGLPGSVGCGLIAFFIYGLHRNGVLFFTLRGNAPGHSPGDPGA